MRVLFYNKGGYSHSAREYEKRYGGCWRNPAALLYKKECVLAPLFKMLEATFELFVQIVVSAIIDVGIAGAD